MTDTVTDPVIAPVTAPAASPQAPATFSREYVQELREEAATWRRKAQGHETEVQSHKTAAEAAVAERDAKIAEARNSADARVVRAELKAVAIKSGMVDLDGLKLLDLSAVKLNDAGEVDGADALIAAAKIAKPWLFAAVSTSSIAPTPPVEAPKDKRAGEMTAAELRAFQVKHGLRA